MNVKRVLATAAVATMVVAGCGSAANISGGQQGATLTKANFGSTLLTATSQARSVHVTGDVTVQGQHVTVAADLAKSGDGVQDAAAAATISMGGMGTVQVRVVGGVLYVNTAALPIAQGTAGKPWVKFPLNDRSNPVGALLGRLTGGLKPTDLAKSFRSISTFSTVGPETVGGVASTHYKVTVDLSKASGLVDLPPGADLSGMPKTVTFDVWLDSSSRPVQVSVVNAQVSLKLQFSKWGQPVHVVAPPASQVGTFSH